MTQPKIETLKTKIAELEQKIYDITTPIKLQTRYAIIRRKHYKKAGDILKSLREKTTLSQRLIAKLLDVTPYAYSCWEQGKMKIADQHHQTFLSVFGKDFKKVIKEYDKCKSYIERTRKNTLGI